MQIMIDFLNSFKSLIKPDKIHTDNNVFKLHYKFTVIMLILFSILLTSKQNFGDPIDCDVEGDRKNIINTYCWIFGTYIIKNTLTERILGGLGNEATTTPYWYQAVNTDTGSEIIWQKYYQWVCIVFVFQALLFYIPRYVWKTWEGGRMRLLVRDLGGPLISPNWNKSVKDRLVYYLLNGKYAHDIYAIRYAICELTNFINVVLQIFLLDWFLAGQFSLYGLNVLMFDNVNPMHKVFPKLTKCMYYKYGVSGTVESRDALCILPLNIVNEKLFLFLWFWLVFLTLASFCALVYRALVLLVPCFRTYLLMAQTNYIKHNKADCVVKKIGYGDFFVLYQVGKNINPMVYKELVHEMYDVLNRKVTYPTIFNSQEGVEV